MQKLTSLFALTVAVISIILLSIFSAQSYAAQVIHAQKSDKINETTQKNINYRIDSYENSYDVKSDYTYTQVTSTLTTVLTPVGIESNQRDSSSYYPETQSLELVEAYVVQPDGKKIKVTAENILISSSQKSQEASKLGNTKTITVSYPKLTVGSKTFIKWKLTQKKASVMGFSHLETPAFSEPTVSETIKISLPASLKLRWQKRGDYAVTDKIKGSQRVITATIKNQPKNKSENGMVSSLDFSSLFIFSNLDRWEDLGAMYWRDSHKKVVVTPEIKQLATKITGNKQGIEAARAIYNWVAQNINYVAIYLQEEAGYIPHSSAEVLRNGYGDCKDYVVLMQALLKAKNIDSSAVLVDWGQMYQNLPLPMASQFNHAIIYLPAFNIFANPTDKNASFGELDASLRKQIYLSTPAGIDIENPLQFRGYITYPKRLYPMVAGARDLSWEYKITIPSNYKVSNLPNNQNFSNSAGEYTSTYQAESGYITVKRHLVIKNDVYSPEEYPAFKELLHKPINDVKSVMVLEKS